MTGRVWNRNFVLLWLGQLVSQLGNRIYLMALAWYFVAHLQNSRGLLILFVASSLPSLLFGLFVGPLVERWNKRNILVVCDLCSGLLTGALALMVHLGSANEPLIYAICFLLNVINLFFSPSVNSLLPVVIAQEHYQRGTSLMKMVGFMGQILGAAVGGVLVGAVGVVPTIVVNSVSFVLSAVSEMFIAYKPEIRRVVRHYRRELTDGLRYVMENPTLRRMILLCISANLFLPVFVVFVPIIIKTYMNLDAWHYGIVDAAIPAGAVVISLLLSAGRKTPRNPIRNLSFGVLAIALGYLCVSSLHVFGVVLAMAFLYGVSTNFVNITAIAYFISSIRADYRGRVFSLIESLSYSTISISYVLATLLSSACNVYMVLAINAACLLAICGMALLWSRQPVTAEGGTMA